MNITDRVFILFTNYIIKRTLHGGLTIWILSSRGKNNISLIRCAHSWNIVFHHSKIKFISSHRRVISSIYSTYDSPRDENIRGGKCIVEISCKYLLLKVNRLNSKHTDLNCVKSKYAHFIRNIFNSIFAETISQSRIVEKMYRTTVNFLGSQKIFMQVTVAEKENIEQILTKWHKFQI